jgi:RNA polymerase sigma-70 factor (ECF subfamily)
LAQQEEEMPADRSSTTRISLLGRLQQEVPDPDAWPQFVQRYGPLLYRWCRSHGLQNADIEDVTQNVLLKLARRLRDFRYDPTQSFRSYLKTLAHYAWCDLLAERQQATQATGDSQVLHELNSVEARDDLARRLGEEFDLELLERARQEVQALVEPQTWEAFRLTAEEGLSGAETAARLNLAVTAVFKARSRVQQMLRERVEQEGE